MSDETGIQTPQWTEDGQITASIDDLVTFNELHQLLHVTSNYSMLHDLMSLQQTDELSVTIANGMIQQVQQQDPDLYLGELVRIRGLRIHVSGPNEESYEVAARSTWRVQKLKLLLSQYSKIAWNDQRLFLSSRELSNDTTLEASLVGHGAQLRMINSRSQEWQIFVKGLANKTMTIRGLSPNSTVEDLRRKVDERHAGGDYYFSYGGTRLNEGRTLQDYKISSGATIHQLARLEGGSHL